jgi:recombination protein RecT
LDIYAKVVREGDEFVEVIENGRQTVSFKPKPFNNGEIIGAFAVCLYKDGGMIYDTMSKEEIEHTRKTFSKQANGKAWTNSYGEMCKKTVLRRLCKMIDLNFDTAEAMQAFEDGSEFDVKHPKTPEPEKAVDVYAEVVPTEVVEVEDAGTDGSN